MFAGQLQAAIEAAPRHQLDHVAGLLWKAFAAGTVSEDEAQRLSDAIEVRKATPRPTGGSGRARAGSRPRTDASMERRRRWASAGRLPPQIQARFTLGESAVLAVVSMLVAKHGDCRLPIAAIAALAGVGETTVRNAMRAAEAEGLLRVQERKVTAWRNLPNVVTIVSKEWSAWLRLRPKGEGANLRTPRDPRLTDAGLRTSEWAKSDAGARQPMRQRQSVDRQIR